MPRVEVSLVTLDPPVRRWAFSSTPRELGEQIRAEWQEVGALASSPRTQYGSTKLRRWSVNSFITAANDAEADFNARAIKVLQSFFYRSAARVNLDAGREPPRLLFTWPNTVLAVVRIVDLDLDRVHFLPDGRTRDYRVSIQLLEEPDDLPITREDVEAFGSQRAIGFDARV